MDNQREYADLLSSQKYVYPLGNLYNYHGDTFISEIENYSFCIAGNFTTIPYRYIKLFKTL